MVSFLRFLAQQRKMPGFPTHIVGTPRIRGKAQRYEGSRGDRDRSKRDGTRARGRGGERSNASGHQVRGDDIDELAGRDDLGFLPELGKMALVAGYEVVGTGGIGTFEEDIVAGVGGDLKGWRGRDEVGAVSDELKEVKAEPFANAEVRARHDRAVLRKDWG